MYDLKVTYHLNERLKETCDSDLIRLHQRGDKTAFAVLYVRHWSSILRFCYQKSGADIQTAEDFASTVFEKALEVMPLYHPRTKSFANFLYRVARCDIIDYFRREEIRPISPIEGLESTLYSDTLSAEEIVMRNEGMSALRDIAINYLSPDQQETYLMRYVEGLRPEQIAELQGTNINAVKSRLHRIKDKLEKTFTRKGLLEIDKD